MLLQFDTGWPQLGHISLNNNQLDAKSMLALAHANLPHLWHLGLISNGVDIAGMQSLLSCSWLHAENMWKFGQKRQNLVNVLIRLHQQPRFSIN